MVGTTVNVERNPNGKFAGAHFSSGGGILPAYGPNFSSAGGGSAEVHFLDENGCFLKKATYVLTATAVGAYFLGETVGSPYTAAPGTFMGDCPQQAYGYIVYARTAAINVGRGGLPKASSVVNLSNPLSSLPEVLMVGDAFAWCFVADSHGYDFRGGEGGDITGTYPSDALSQDALNPANILRGTPADITDNTAHDVIAAQAAGVRIYITEILVTNNHASTATVVKITDGSGGTTLFRGNAAPGSGFVVTGFDRTTAATALSAICETNSSSIQITAHGFKSAN